MESLNTYSVQEVVDIMDDYADVTIEFTRDTELNRNGIQEAIIYIELGQSLDVFGLDDIYYKSEKKAYFIFFSSFLEHFNRATDNTLSPTYVLHFNSDKLEELTLNAATQ